MSPDPSRAARGVASVTVGALALMLSFQVPIAPGHYSDFDQVWIAANAIHAGDDPFAAVASQHEYPLVYPIPAALVALPLGAVPLGLARAIFIGIGTGVLTWGLLGRGWWGLLLLLAYPTWSAFFVRQWSPLLTGAAIASPILFGLVAIAKPTIGLILAAAFPSRSALMSAAAITTVSILIVPDWPFRWFAALESTPQITPLILRPGGFLLLLGLLRWRRPEGRLVAALALVPHAAAGYEALLLYLVPRRAMDAVLLVGATWLGYLWALAATDPAPSLELLLEDRWPFLFVSTHLPMLYLVLRRPNNPDERPPSRTTGQT